ncbi:carbohydrate porin [Bradyrhizobium sp. TZ2]
MGNALGGIKRIAVYEGRLNLAVDVDLQKLVGAEQLTFHANVFQIHGGGLSRGALQNLFVVSGIEALPTTRLYEAKFEKQWGAKLVSLKLGQLAADSELFIEIHGRLHERVDGMACHHLGRPSQWRPWEPACSST